MEEEEKDMCECGCSSFDPQFKFPGPDGKWYLVAVYDSCEDCDTPAGVDFWLIGPRVAARDYGIRVAEIPDLDFHDDRPASAALAVLHPRILRRRLVESMDGLEVEGGKLDRDLAEVVVEDAFREHFRVAVHETQKMRVGDGPDEEAQDATIDGAQR